MLIFTRNIGKSFLVGDDVRITILGVNNRNQVRIGVSAPTSVSVDREEVRERKLAVKEES